MALNPKTAVASRNLALDAAFDVMNSGFARGYDGTQPSDSDAALSSNNLLFSCALGSTAFAAASAGSKTANSITADSSADATGTCSFASLLTSGAVRKFDGSAGTSSANWIFNTVSIVSAANVSISSLALSLAA